MGALFTNSPKKKLFSASQQDKLKQIIVVGDLYESQERQVGRLFDILPFPGVQKGEALLNSHQEAKKKGKKPSKPLFLTLQRGQEFTPGSPNKHAAKRSFESFVTAAALWKALPKASLITLPVSKELIMESTPRFDGHTGFISRLYGQSGVMCMYHPELSVIPLTQHIPIKAVPTALKKVDMEALKRALLFFQSLMKPKKPFAFTGLNPHAGENGKIGDEEEVIKKYIAQLQKAGINIEGPFPADGVFIAKNRKRYSLIVATYHDQALIPFKALFGAEGVNITLNLPALRVSPDHGPAYEFAGKSGADWESVYNSLLFALANGEKWINQYCSPSESGSS